MWKCKVLDLLREISAKLDKVLANQAAEKIQENKEMAVLDDLTTQVTNTEGIEQSAIVLINGLAAQLAAAIAAGNPAALTALQQRLAVSAKALSDAIVANSPAPTPAPAPTPTPAPTA